MSERPKEQQQPKQLNKDYMINSLKRQLADAAHQIAEGDAIIGELTIKIQELEKDNKNLRDSIQKNERSDKPKSVENKPNAKQRDIFMHKGGGRDVKRNRKGSG